MLTLEKFEEASEVVKQVTTPTKLVYSEYLSAQTGARIYLKPENMQHTGAYKLRGAYYKISTLSEEDRSKGLITASAGNHAQGVAYAAKRYGCRATIVMPIGTPLIKVNRTKSYGAEVILYGDVYDDACAYAYKLAEEHGYTFVHPFDDLDALGGEMGKVIDRTFIQSKMLNSSKGPAVHSLRAQADKANYSRTMRQVLQKQENLDIRQMEVTELLTEDGKITGVQTYSGAIYRCRAVVLCTGTYLKARCIYGEISTHTGPNGLQSANYLTDSLKALGIRMYRFKTGTPARIDKTSIDFLLYCLIYSNLLAINNFLNSLAFSILLRNLC